MKLISIIIPCYNHERFISDCLDSLIAQTYKNIELLVVDDASTDNSWKVIDSYRARLNKRFVNTYLKRNEKNCGVTANLNSMIKLADGEIIKILASDDFLNETYCETIARLFSEQDGDLVLTNAVLVEEESTFDNIREIRNYYKANPFDSLKGSLFENIFRRNFICAPSMALSANIYKKYGLYDESLYAEDLDYWLNITKNDSEFIIYCNIPLVYYRQNSSSMSSLNNTANFEKRIIRMHDNSMETRIKYKNYLGRRKFNMLMIRTILHYYRISKIEHLSTLKERCIDDKKYLDHPYDSIIRLLK